MGAKISIVIPSYNHCHYLRKTIESIIVQGYADVEIFVADGGSSDGTVELLKELEKTVGGLRWISEPDNGPADAVNKGLSQVSGDVVGIQSSDDMYLDGAFSKVVTAFNENPSTGLVLGDVCGVDSDDNVLYYRRYRNASWSELCAVSLCIPQSSIFFRRQLIQEVGFWNGEYYGCDLDYWFRILMQTQAQHIPYVLSAWRRYPEQRTRPDQYKRIWDDYWRMIDRTLSQATVSGRLRRWLVASKHLLVLRFPPNQSFFTLWKHFILGVALHPGSLLYNPWRQYLCLVPFSESARTFYSKIKRRA